MTNDLNVSTTIYSILAPEQRWFIKNLSLPARVHIPTNSDFDTKYINTEDNLWRYSVGGTLNKCNFNSNDRDLNKLLKYVLVILSAEGSIVYEKVVYIIKNQIFHSACDENSYLNSLNSASKLKEDVKFYSIARVFRVFCRMSLPGFTLEGLDALEFIPRPNTNNTFLKYQDIENAFPTHLKRLISNGLVQWSNKLETLNKGELSNLLVLGLAFVSGLRPSQFSKLAAKDICLDSESKLTQIKRYSLNISYSKQTKLINNKYRIAIPEEVGLISFEYIKRHEIKPNEQLFPLKDKLPETLQHHLNKALLFLQSEETKKAISNGKFSQPQYTLYDFRHNIGHSLAMQGASAEQIAYILGHSSTVPASHYISATPELALLKHRALGKNNVWNTMINLMVTGDILDNDDWNGYRVNGFLKGILISGIGGCNRTDE